MMIGMRGPQEVRAAGRPGGDARPPVPHHEDQRGRLERQKQGQNDGQEQVDNDGHSTLFGILAGTRPESTLWAGECQVE